MPWGIQNIDLIAIIVHLHNRRSDGDAPLLLDFHPVGLGEFLRLLPLGLDRPGFPDGSREEQELLGDGRLPRVRVRNNGKGPALGYLTC